MNSYFIAKIRSTQRYFRGFDKNLRQVVDYGGISEICKGSQQKNLAFRGPCGNFGYY